MSKPNLLFIFTDEQRLDTMASYGNPYIDTPNMDRLANESVLFEQAYVTQSVCTPSRSSLMTGLYPHTNGCTQNNVSLSSDIPSLAELLDDPAYATAYHGKWHLGDEIFAQHGFDEWVSIDDGYAAYYSEGRDKNARSSYHHFLTENGFTPENGSVFTRDKPLQVPEEYSKPAFLAQEASRFIREHQEQPFVLTVNFFEPHMPFFSQRDQQYDPADVVLPPNFECPPTNDQPLKTRAFRKVYEEGGHSGLSLRTEQDWRRMIANYWGLNSLVDTHLGKILDTIDECGLREDTIVVYTSDHGDMMGSHQLLAKCVMFEEAVKVPLMIRLPGQKEGRRVSGPFSQIDLVPTLLDLMGQSIPDHLEVKSIKTGLEQDGDLALAEDVFIEWNGPNNGFGDKLDGVSLPESMLEVAPADDLTASITDPVRTVITSEGWKFNCSPLGEHELYNLNADPIETINLAGDRGYLGTMRELRERIVAWQRRTGDSVELPKF